MKRAFASFFLVMKAEFVRSWIITRRYWFRTVSGIIIGYGMLVMMIAGFIYSRPSIPNGVFGEGEAAANYVLGFILGIYAFGVVGMFSQGLQEMMGTGVLEQLCMSPHGLITNFLARCAMASFTTVISSSILVWMVTKSFGGILHFDLLPLMAVLALTFANMIGFGFMVGGLVLVVKQVGQVAVLLRMTMFGLAVFAREELLHKNIALTAFMHTLPITDAAICLKYVLVKGQIGLDGQFHSVFAYGPFYFLMVSCVVWTFIGLTLFRVMEDWSRKKGTLGSY